MSVQITKKSEEFSISPQLNLEEISEVAKLGFKTIINNRPDGEGGASQPTSEQIRLAAEKLGLAYFYIPVIPSNIQAEQIKVFSLAYANAAKPILGFCKTGNRASRMLELLNTKPATYSGGLLT